MALTKVAPLRTSFMAIAILGFLVSTIYLVQFSLTWGFAFALVFMAMIIASFIAMERATPDEQLEAIPRLVRRRR